MVRDGSVTRETREQKIRHSSFRVFRIAGHCLLMTGYISPRTGSLVPPISQPQKGTPAHLHASNLHESPSQIQIRPGPLETRGQSPYPNRLSRKKLAAR